MRKGSSCRPPGRITRLFSACAALAALASPAFAATDIAALQAYREGLSAALEHSDQPRDWALASLLLDAPVADRARNQKRSALLDKAVRAAPADRIVLAIWANTPFAAGNCVRRAGCLDGARVLARLEPENGAAWLPVVQHAARRNDARAVDAAIHQLAQASRYNEHIGQALAAWRDVFRRYPGPKGELTAAGSSASEDTLDLSAYEAEATAMPPAAPLIDACSRRLHPSASPIRFRDCGTAARLMMGRSQTLDGRLAGVAVLRASHEGTGADIERVRTVTWQAEQYARLKPEWSNAALKQNHQAMIESTDSEMQVIDYELTIGGRALTPPPNWKQTMAGRPIGPLEEPGLPPP